jgi:hypothetical protein
VYPKLLLLIPIIVFSQCKPKTYTVENLSDEYIAIGSFGGFAGTEESYYFLENGQLFYTNSMTGDKELEPISKKQFKAMKKELIELDFQNRKLNEPGNMNYFIQLNIKNVNHKVLWSNPETAPKDLVEFMDKHLKDIQTHSIQ